MITEDLEILKNICYDNNGEKMFYIDISSDECERFIQIIETILEELETYKNIVAEIEKYIDSIKEVTVKIVNKPKFDWKDELIWELNDEKSGLYKEIELDKIEKILKLKEVKKDESI